VGRCWAKIVNRLRTQKKKEGGLRRWVGTAAGPKVRKGKGLFFSFFFQNLFPPKTNKQNLNSKQDLNPNTQKNNATA
jgi:hypothetical protein